jgi:hypothetical protein
LLPRLLCIYLQIKSESIALQQARAIDGCYAASTPLLFRNFCEILVRLSAARYPLLTSLEQQLQQVISYHLLPLLGGSARQLAGGDLRASVMPAAAAAGAVGSEGLSGCEQQLRSPEVVQYLRQQTHLLQQLFAVFVEAGHGAAAACPVTDGGSDSASTTPALLQAAPAVAAASGTSAAEEQEHNGAAQGEVLLWQQEAVSVQHVVACLQAAGVLQQHQLSMEAAAACLLHNNLAVTDPQGVR